MYNGGPTHPLQNQYCRGCPQLNNLIIVSRTLWDRFGLLWTSETLQIDRRAVPQCPPWKSTQLWKKSRPKRFIMKKVRAFWNRSPNFFEIEKSSKFSLKMKNWEIETFPIFNENFRCKNYYLKKIRKPISKYSNFIHNKLFWSRFLQSCVACHGGHDGTGSQLVGRVLRGGNPRGRFFGHVYQKM